MDEIGSRPWGNDIDALGLWDIDGKLARYHASSQWESEENLSRARDSSDTLDFSSVAVLVFATRRIILPDAERDSTKDYETPVSKLVSIEATKAD